MGFNIGHQENTVVAMWYLYGSDNKATFLQLSGPLIGGQVQGQLYRASGPPPGPGFNPASVSYVSVGTATLAFNAENSAVFTYSYEGRAGLINLQRFTFSALDITGPHEFAATGNVTGCTNAAYNATSYASVGYLVSAKAGAVHNFSWFTENRTCQITASLSQHGTVLSGEGTFVCSEGIAGRIELGRLRRIDDFLIGEYSMRATQGETCVDRGKFAAVRN